MSAKTAAALEGIEGLLADWMRAKIAGMGATVQMFRQLRAGRKTPRFRGTAQDRQWRNLKAFYDFTCLSCERREPEITLTRDHINPKGENDITNIQPLCEDCGQAKSDAHIDYRIGDIAARAIRRAAAARAAAKETEK